MNPVLHFLTDVPVVRGALVDLDPTLFLLLGIFLLLYVFLRFTLFRPVLRVLEERERRIEGAKAEARRMQERADQALAEYNEFVREARNKGAELRVALRQEGLRIEREILAEVRRETARQLAEGKAVHRAEMERAMATLEHEVATLAQQAARRLLGRPVGAADERQSG
jgi:F-type H+-transporting ATPase subunit b